MPNLILLVGNIGSGKSTLAKELAKKDYIVISRDALRYMIGGGKYIFKDKYESFVKHISLDLLREAIDREYNIVMDECNMNLSLRRSILLCKTHIYKAFCIEMPKLSKEESVQNRLQKSHGKFKKERWEKVYDMFTGMYSKPLKKEGFDKIIRLKKNYKLEDILNDLSDS